MTKRASFGTRNEQVGSSIVLAMIAVAAVAAIGAAGWLVYQHNQPSTPKPPTSSSTKQLTQSTTDPYAGWQTHHDTGYPAATGITIKYPSDWTVSTASTKTYAWSIVKSAGTSNVITVSDVFQNGSQTARQEWESCEGTDACGGSADDKTLTGSESSINGFDAYSATMQNSNGVTYHVTVIRGNKATPPAGTPYVEFFTDSTDKAALNTFDKIVASATFPG